LANRYQYFWSELLVDHPKNPRRARSADESAERTQRLEGICDETLGLLSVMAARTTPSLLPEATRYFPLSADRVEDSGTGHRPPGVTRKRSRAASTSPAGASSSWRAVARAGPTSSPSCARKSGPTTVPRAAARSTGP
jgi:hypothetical protein